MNKMKKGFIFLAVILFLFIAPNMVSSAKVDTGIIEKLNDEQEVSVIVMLKDRSISLKGLSTLGKPDKTILEQKKTMIKEQQDKVLSNLNLNDKTKNLIKLNNAKSNVSTTSSDADFNLRHKYSTVNGFSGMVTNNGLEKLMNDPNVENVYLNREVHITLDQSIPQINADDVWKLKLNNVNITGKDETICIIDTGIDYNHTNLGDGWGNKVIGGYRSLNDKTDVQECDSNHSACFDDNNHGTHVAGIIISNDTTYRGVAPDAKLIAIKVMNSSGSGLYSDIIAGIDWCVNNASIFNISVITMSLGDESEHNTYCNSDATTSSINSAVGVGIIVTVAAGNCDWGGATCVSGVASPACVENATPVGAVNDGDTIGFQRGDILNLLAPGYNIYSTIPNSWASYSGTSMSTPHVAGAAALLKQFVRLYNGTDITPQEIEDVLNDTGVQVYDDATGRYYSRIDVYAAILSLDTTAPQYSDVGKNDTEIKFNDVVKFYATWSDSVGLSHYIFSWNNSGYWVNDSAVSLTFWSNLTQTVTATGKPEIGWKIYANDSANNWNNTGIQTFNISNSISTITANVTSPDTVYTNTDFKLNLTITDIDNDTLTAYVQFYINNTANGSVQPQTVQNGTNTLIGTLGSGNFSKDYNLTAEFWAGDGTENTTKTNTTIVIVQNSAPTQPSLTNPKNQSIQTSVNITINWTASTDVNNGSITYFIHFLNSSPPTYNLSTQDLYKTFTDLTDNETYYWYIIANDGTDNSTASEQRQFTIDTSIPLLNFVDPTPTEGERLTDNYIYVNVTVDHSSLNISNCTLLWNSTHNHSMTKIGTGISVNCWINMTSLDGINYTYSVMANTTDGIKGTTGNRTNLENTKPTLSTNSSINNSNPYTNDILNCDAGTFSDDDSGDSENQSLWSWYADDVLNATTQTLNLSNAGLNKNVKLRCSQRVADGYELSVLWYNSSEFTILNTAPTQSSLNSPTGGAINQLLTVTLNITITDIDGDNMNISFYDSSDDSLLETNNNLSNGSYATYEWSGLGYSTTYEWYVNITDGINTSKSQNWSFTTKTEPTSTSGGGGGGGSSVTYEQESLGTLAGGSGKTVTFSKSETLAVTEITVTVKNKVTNAKIKVDTGSLPSGVSVPSSAKGSVYKYITITKTSMTDNDVSKGIIKFKVKKEWLTDKSYGKDTIILHRYYDNKWNKLTTTRDSQDTTYYYYSAESPGFSTFAITAEKATTKTTETKTTIKEVLKEEKSEAEENVTTEEPEEEPPVEAPPKEEKEAKSNTTLIVTLIAVIIALIIVSHFVQEKKQKKKKEYKKEKKKKPKRKK